MVRNKHQENWTDGTEGYDGSEAVMLDLESMISAQRIMSSVQSRENQISLPL